MNTDLISRSELKSVLKNECFWCANRDEPCDKSCWRCINEKIDNASTVEERPHGEWITLDRNDRFKTGLYKCNLCGYKNPVPDEASKNFCPNCGADMRGGKEK